MAISRPRSRQQRELERSSLARRFKLPNPGDIYLLALFIWSSLCVVLIVGGRKVAWEAAKLSSSAELRQLFLSEQFVITWLLVIGALVMAAAFFLIARYRSWAIAALFFSFAFANALWKPLHDVAFLIKYLLLFYLGVTAFIFMVRNGWQLIALEGYKIVCIYVGWIAVIALVNGISITNYWYLSTEFTLMLGFGVAWMSQVNSTEKLERFNRVLAYTAVVVTVGHFLSVLVMPSFTTEQGRFFSMIGNANGFSIVFTLYVVSLFWLCMYEKKGLMKRLYAVVALAGYGLILWSGTRNAVVSAMIGIGIIWWVTRSRIFFVLILIGAMALLVEFLLLGIDDVAKISDRLTSTENTRLDIWQMYLGLFADSPIMGYSPGGLAGAVHGESLAGVVGKYARVNVPSTHNMYLGFAVRYGLVGLIFSCMLFFIPLRMAWKVLRSSHVDIKDKQVYVLPAVLLLIVALEGLFEDFIGSGGRGTTLGLVLATGFPVVYFHGKRLLAKAEASTEESNKQLINKAAFV